MQDSKHENEVEGLRGLASLQVLYCHLLYHGHELDPHFTPHPFLMRFEMSRASVMLFFILSGYVIGLCNREGDYQGSPQGFYARRLLRLMPLYLLAVGLSALVTPANSIQEIIGNLFFLQNDQPYGPLCFPLLQGNTNLWSLNYEALYYLVFPLLWLLPARALALLPFAVIGFTALSSPLPAIVGLWTAGWIFWLVGFQLSRSRQETPVDKPELRAPWPSICLCMIYVWHMTPLYQLFIRVGLSNHQGFRALYSLDYVLPALALLAVCTGRVLHWRKTLLWSALAIPLIYSGWRLAKGRFGADDSAFYDLLAVASLCLVFWKPGLGFFRKFVVVGQISYGLYIFARPVQYTILRCEWLPSGTVWTFTLRLTLCLALTGAIAWLAEAWLQPKVAKRLRPLLGLPPKNTPAA